MRTWTASVTVWSRGTRLTFAATDSEYDLLRDQTLVAVREASPFVDDASQVEVTLWKNTKARGLEADRRFNVWRDRRGDVRYQ